MYTRCKEKVLGGVFLSLIEMLRLTISRMDSFYTEIVATLELTAFTLSRRALLHAQ